MRSLACVVVMALVAIAVKAESWVRVNQMGYLPNDIKVAVMIMEQPEIVKSFKVTNVATGKSVKINKVKLMGEQYPFGGTARLDFSQITEPGTYYITAGSAKSREFKIGKNVYAGANEVPLRYMRQQRCGFNPFLKDSCHTIDGRIVLSGEVGTMLPIIFSIFQLRQMQCIKCFLLICKIRMCGLMNILQMVFPGRIIFPISLMRLAGGLNGC